MKCEEIKKLVYLYDVITSGEKEKTDNHLLTCQACRALHEQLQQERSLIKNSASVHQKISYPEKLTSQIMSAINVKRTSPSYSVQNVFSVFDLAFPRYALAIMSLFLIGFFIYEQGATGATGNREKVRLVVSKESTRLGIGLHARAQSPSDSSVVVKQRVLQDRKLSLTFLNSASTLNFLKDKEFLQFTETYFSKGPKNKTISLYRELYQCMQQCSNDEKQNCDDCKIMLNQLIQKYESI